MTRKTHSAGLLTLGSALLLSAAVHAQPPGGMPPGSIPPGANYPQSTGQATAPGTVSNQAVDATTTTTTTTTGSDVIAEDTAFSEESTLANTGGEPWLIAMMGLTVAAGALTLRRRFNN